MVTTGGPLREVARRAEPAPPASSPAAASRGPRSATRSRCWPGILERAGHLDLAAEEVEAAAVAATATLATIDPAVPTDANPAKQLAW